MPKAASPQLHISASAIRSLSDCKREFAFKYLLGLPREDLSPSMILGSAIHKSLELFYLALKDGKPEPDFDTMFRVAALAISKAIVGDTEIAFGRGESPEGLVEEAARLLEVFVESGYRPARVLGVEVKFALMPSHPITGEIAEGFEEHVIGFFDLVCLDENGSVRILDHKISKRYSPPKSTAADIQAALYMWAGDLLLNQRVQMYHQTLVRTKKPRVELTEIPRSHGDSAEAIEGVWSALELINVAVAHPEPLRLLGRQRGWKCGSCAYRKRCEEPAYELNSSPVQPLALCATQERA